MSRTSYNKPAGRPTWRVRLVVGLLALVLLPSFASAQSVADKYRRNQERNSRFNLAAGPTTVLQVNDYQCGLVNDGATCTDVFDSPTGGGGFWPTGSPNQYMFNSGLQIAGIIPIAATCTNKATGTTPDCFPWAGDTTGAFFFDASGLRQHGTAITNIYDSLNPDDLAVWPAEGSFPDFPTATAYVQDPDLFNDVLIGRQAASQQDSWVMYWDGDPNLTGGRQHPMGILVEQRSLAWNYPVGNENVIYFIYKFTNVTANPLFQQLNETRFAIELPNAGWRYDSIYVAFAADPDVTPDAGENYSTAILPFNMGIAYKDNFLAPDFVYPPDLFHQPFFEAAPGIVAMQYLKSPIDPATQQEVGLTSFSLTTNGGAFPDPSSVQRGWRYISLNVDAGKGDPNCSFSEAEVAARRSCYLGQTPADVRMFVGSGPFSLDPGASSTIAVAQYAAATVDQAGTIVPGNDNQPGLPSATPGCASQPVRPIERAAGWVSVTCPAAGEPLNLFDVNVVSNSLLGRAQVAQSIFTNKFLLGFAPDAPLFFLVPGDDQITIVWEPSATEQTGDPFFAAAGDPDNPLFDPNYREFDVEGYRIYRGSSPADLNLVAQFDKAGSIFTDNLCVTDPTYVVGDPCTDVTEVDIAHPFVQYTSVQRLENGDPIVLAADTATAPQIAAGDALAMSNTGVPFTYVDTDVRNGFQYFYRVTAFDVNSIQSGPSSLESAAGSKSTVPNAAATTLTDSETSFALLGRGGDALTGTMPTIDPATGTFSGPMPPTDLINVTSIVDFASLLLPVGNTTVITIDSVFPQYYPNGAVAIYHVTLGTLAFSFTPDIDISGGGATSTETFQLPGAPVPADPAARQEMRSQGIDAPPVSATLFAEMVTDRPHFHSGDSDWVFKQPGFWNVDPDDTSPGGSRWFTGAGETLADPAAGLRLRGELPGIATIFSPMPYMETGSPTDPPAMADYGAAPGCTNGGGACDEALFRRFYGTTFGLRRAADVNFYWGATGLDSVVDVTHNVAVQFKPSYQASYGFLTDSDADGVLTYGDFYWVPGLESAGNIFRYSESFPRPLVAQPVVLATDVDGDLAGDGTGFGLHINGEPYLFEGPVPTNTVWTLRTYNGEVTQDEAGQYSFAPSGRPAAVPGLRIAVTVVQPGSIVAAEADLSRVHTVPDPYYVASTFDLSPTSKELQFVNMPAEATVRIYSLSGILVDVINHNDLTGGGRAVWDLRNRSDQFVASGVYLFHVSTPDGKSAVGKFTVINSGIAR